MCYQTIFSNLWVKIIKCTSAQDPWHTYALVYRQVTSFRLHYCSAWRQLNFWVKKWLKTRIGVRIHFDLEICQPPGLHPSHMLSSVTVWPSKMGLISCTNKCYITFKMSEDLSYTAAAVYLSTSLKMIQIKVVRQDLVWFHVNTWL
jgi:hypothetical protein